MVSFQPDKDGWMDGWAAGRMDGWVGSWEDGWMDVLLYSWSNSVNTFHE